MEELKAFPLSEIADHSSKKDCWLIIHDKVYDVTKFLEEHPGGGEVLIKASASGDATEAFFDQEVGHTSTATSMMTAYLIGVVEGSSSGQQSFRVGVEEGYSTAKKSTQDQNSCHSFSFYEYLLALAIFAMSVGAWCFLYRSL